MNKILEVKNLSKLYYTKNSSIEAIKDLTLDIEKNKFTTIVGPSGCGKSTLLNIIAGLEEKTEGIINIKSNNIGFMHQSDCLFPWLTIYENTLLGLKIKHKNTKENQNYVKNLLKKYNLDEFKDKYPNSLSGGMKQRIALIRTLALKPDILLLDEAFNALDYQTRLKVSNDVYDIIKKEGITCIMVSHDLEEAIAMSDNIIVLSKRPSTVKSVINIEIDKNKSPIERRKDEKFREYFNYLWSELDNYE